RPRARRGDRSHSGDRQLHPDGTQPVRVRRHDCEPAREPVPGGEHRPADRGADLPRAGAARDHVPHELRRAARRQALRVPAHGRRVMEHGALSLKATGRGRRRLLVNRLAEGSAVFAALLAILVLAIVIWSVGRRGAGAINLDFFLKGPSSDFFGGGGGIAPALAGTLLLVGVATLIALPTGVLTAIFVSEFAPVRAGQ